MVLLPAESPVMSLVSNADVQALPCVCPDPVTFGPEIELRPTQPQSDKLTILPSSFPACRILQERRDCLPVRVKRKPLNIPCAQTGTEDIASWVVYTKTQRALHHML
jgi:hypothetical protein